MKIRFAAGVALFAALLAPPLIAQEMPKPPVASAPTARATSLEGMRVPVKVTVVLSRYQGDKRISNMPYVLGVMASSRAYGPPQKTTLRMGVNAPITQTVFSSPTVDGKPGPVQSSYSYRDVGTNIDCTVTFDESVAGLFQVSLTVTDSSLGLDAPKRSGVAPDAPSFRNFNSSFTALLRDGQTMQYTSATDPVTGEVMKIDVTMNVMK
jgi:hypothetical protein